MTGLYVSPNTHAVFAYTAEGGATIRLTEFMPYADAVAAHERLVGDLPPVLPCVLLFDARSNTRRRVTHLAVRSLGDAYWQGTVREGALQVFSEQAYGDEAPEVAAAEDEGTEVVYSRGLRIAAEVRPVVHAREAVRA